MSTKLIHFRDQNQGISNFERCNNNFDDDKISNPDSQEAKTPTIGRPARSKITNKNESNNNQGQRKRMSSDLEYDGDNIVIPTDLDSSVSENTPQIKKRKYSSKSSNIVKSPYFNIGYELLGFGKRIKYLYVTAPAASRDDEEEIEIKWYQYEINEKLGTFYCKKCTNKKVWAKLDEEKDEVTLGRNKHICQPKIYPYLKL